MYTVRYLCAYAWGAHPSSLFSWVWDFSCSHHPTLLACQPNQLIPFLITGHTLPLLSFLAYSSPDQVGQPVGKDAFAPLRWIPPLPSSPQSAKRFPWSQNPKPCCRNQLRKQWLTGRISLPLYPSPAGLRKPPGLHSLDHYSQSHIVTLDTIQVFPVVLFVPIRKSSRE